MWQANGRYIAPEGRANAQIAVVVDAPRLDDIDRPLAGEPGRLLSRLLRMADIDRANCWLDSVSPYAPAKGRIDLIPPEEVGGYAELLRLRLSALPDLRLVVPLGPLSLTALTGKVGLTKWRGSVLTPLEGAYKVLPALHPAMLIKQPELTRRALVDFERVGDELASPQPVRVPKARNFIVYPSEPDIRYFEASLKAADLVAVDIETNPSSGDLLCVGFSRHDREAICIPYTTSFNRQAIRRICEHACGKAFHNGLYDVFWLRWLGIQVTNWALDTLFLHAVMEPTEEHSLAHIASLYTDEPYWKDEAKDPKEGSIVKVYKPSESLYKYNCRDAAVTRELADTLQSRAEEMERLKLYQTLIHPLFEPIMDMMLTGLRVDDERRKAKFEELSGSLSALQADLEKQTGVNLFGKTSLSVKKLQTYFYETLKLPKIFKKQPTAKGEKSLATDEATILKLINKYPAKLGEVGPLLLSHRRVSQLSKFYQEQRVDPDGYFRFTLKPDTEAGRLSSKKSPLATGSNAQNIDREARGIYLPDPGQIFMEFDLSQVESRIVYVLSGDEKLKAEANLKPWEGDQHKENAALLFAIDITEVTKEQRQIGKITSHGAQRAMTGMKLQEVLLKGGYNYTAERCNQLVARYYETHPGVLAYFQRIRWEVINNRKLVNSWGRVLEWPFERLDDSLFRKAYSFRPQSDAADFLNQRGLIPAYRWLKDNGMKSRLALTVHDSLLFSVEPDEAWDLLQFVTASLAAPLILDGFPLTIPVELAMGVNWSKGVEFKKLPTREEFAEKLQGVLNAGG